MLSLRRMATLGDGPVSCQRGHTCESCIKTACNSMLLFKLYLFHWHSPAGDSMRFSVWSVPLYPESVSVCERNPHERLCLFLGHVSHVVLTYSAAKLHCPFFIVDVVVYSFMAMSIWNFKHFLWVDDLCFLAALRKFGHLCKTGIVSCKNTRSEHLLYSTVWYLIAHLCSPTLFQHCISTESLHQRRM